MRLIAELSDNQINELYFVSFISPRDKKYKVQRQDKQTKQLILHVQDKHTLLKLSMSPSVLVVNVGIWAQSCRANTRL